MLILNEIILGSALLLFAAAAITDLLHRRIPNLLVLAIVVLAVTRIVASGDVAIAMQDMRWAGLILVVSFALWTRRWLGAGDAKLIFAAALLVGAQTLPDFLLLTTLFGGGLGVCALGDIWLEKYYGLSMGIAFPIFHAAIPGTQAQDLNKPSIPYGIAVSLGCLATLFSHSFA